MTAKKKPSKAKPTTRVFFSEALVDKVCERIALGESLVAICRDAGMPGFSTFMKWLHENQGQIVDKYARAREAQADFYAEQIITISDEETTTTKSDGQDGPVEVVFDSTAVARNRLRVDARKWYASKVAPKKYGDKQEVVHSGQVDIANALAEARGRVGTSD